MRSVFDHPHEAAERAQRGAREIARSHSPEAAGTAMERRLRWIAARSARPPVVEPAAGSPTAVRTLVEQGPWDAEHSPLGPVGRAAREAMLRLMRPYTAYEQSVDQEIDRALSQLTARVEQMEADRRRAGLGMAEALFHARRQAEQLRRRDAGGSSRVPVPPADLSVRVTGSEDPDWYDESGRRHLALFERALSQVGKRLSEFEDIYDFGCGPGRIMRHLAEAAPQARLHGSDVQAPGVEWLRQQLPEADLRVNGGLPPLPFPGDSFDLVISWRSSPTCPRDTRTRGWPSWRGWRGPVPSCC